MLRTTDWLFLTFQGFLDCLTFDDGTDKLSEISATNYQSTLRNIPKQRIPHLQLRLVTINSMTYLYSVPFAHVRNTTVDCLMYKFGSISIAHWATFVQLSRKKYRLMGKSVQQFACVLHSYTQRFCSKHLSLPQLLSEHRSKCKQKRMRVFVWSGH
jgi:hypothetical protein